jgi:hypothetical protein
VIASEFRLLPGFCAVGPPSVLPEILEPIGRHFGISNRVHDIFVAYVVLECSGIVPDKSAHKLVVTDPPDWMVTIKKAG